MASIYAELHLAGHVCPVRKCSWDFTQATDGRGRVSAKVRAGRVQLLLDVPTDDFLLDWAQAPYKPLAGHVVFFDAKGGVASESVAWEAGHCVGYREEFETGSATTGAYVCQLTIVAPKLTLHAGAPTPYAPPAPDEHGQPPVASAPAAAGLPDGTVSTCPPDVTARLQLQVELMCKPKGVSARCTEADACPSLLEKMALTQSCINARRTINSQCFGGGNAGHQKAIVERQNGFERCKAIYKRQCGPIPEPTPIPVSVPSREPVTEPVDHKPSPAIPVTLTGVALLIYLITSAFRPGPI